MDDLIRRQDAINELSYCQTYLFDSRDHDKKISLEDAEYTIERLPSAQQWIPLTKKLPEVGQIVLICTASKSVKEATYKGLNSQEETVWLSHGNVLWDDDVVRWMPLPEPYKEGENDG